MRIVNVILLWLCVLYSMAQDIHFSEYYTSPINLNPAQTGMFLGDIRASISYRDQYRAVADPYQTMSVAVDGRKTNVFGRKHSYGLGAIVNADVAGDANFGFYEIGVPFAFHFFLSRKARFSTGFLLSFQTYSINENNLRFGDQFSGMQYHEELPTSESTQLKNPLTFSIAPGVNFRYYVTDRNIFALGLSVYNLNRPTVSLYADAAVRQYHRYTATAKYKFEVARYADAIPMVRMTNQGPSNELQAGAQLYKYLRSSALQAISGGAWFRALDRDAIIANVGFFYGMLYVGINYDVNISKLSKASNNRGAFEIHGIIYFDKSKRKKKQKIVSCPGHV